MAIFSQASKPNGTDAPATPHPHPMRRKGDGVPLSIVAADMTITGDLETKGLVKIEGTVRGTIRSGDQVLLAPGALIEGDLYTREAVIGGEVRGAIHASDRVELQATAVVTGDIVTQRIVVLEGGRVSGEIKMDLKPSQPGSGKAEKSDKPVRSDAPPPRKEVQSLAGAVESSPQ